MVSDQGGPMIKLPKNYGNICIIAMISSYILVMVIAAGVLLKSGDIQYARAISDIGLIVVTSVFGLLAVPCAFNYHKRKGHI